MARYRCLSCRGEYPDAHPDGSVYFHTCPPERVTGHPKVNASGDVLREAPREPIANPRDERPSQEIVRDPVTGKASVITRVTAEGAGREEIEDPNPAPTRAGGVLHE